MRIGSARPFLFPSVSTKNGISLRKRFNSQSPCDVASGHSADINRTFKLDSFI